MSTLIDLGEGMTDTISKTREPLVLQGITDLIFLISGDESMNEVDASGDNRINQGSLLLRQFDNFQTLGGTHLIQANDQWTEGETVHDNGSSFNGFAVWRISDAEQLLSILNSMTFSGANNPEKALISIGKGLITPDKKGMVGTGIIWFTSSVPSNQEDSLSVIKAINELTIVQVGGDSDLTAWLNSVSDNNTYVRTNEDITASPDSPVITLIK